MSGVPVGGTQNTPPAPNTRARTRIMTITNNAGAGTHWRGGCEDGRDKRVLATHCARAAVWNRRARRDDGAGRIRRHLVQNSVTRRGREGAELRAGESLLGRGARQLGPLAGVQVPRAGAGAAFRRVWHAMCRYCYADGLKLLTGCAVRRHLLHDRPRSAGRHSNARTKRVCAGIAQFAANQMSP